MRFLSVRLRKLIGSFLILLMVIGTMMFIYYHINTDGSVWFQSKLVKLMNKISSNGRTNGSVFIHLIRKDMTPMQIRELLGEPTASATGGKTGTTFIYIDYEIIVFIDLQGCVHARRMEELEDGDQECFQPDGSRGETSIKNIDWRCSFPSLDSNPAVVLVDELPSGEMSVVPAHCGEEEKTRVGHECCFQKRQ